MVHHITLRMMPLNAKTPYTGSKTVKIGNDFGLYIKHIGYVDFIIPNNCYIFSLNKLLHVPHINKNVLSVSRFAHDNVVFFEFHPHHYLVKRHDTK